jgi:hypothetical protein
LDGAASFSSTQASAQQHEASAQASAQHLQEASAKLEQLHLLPEMQQMQQP